MLTLRNATRTGTVLLACALGLSLVGTASAASKPSPAPAKSNSGQSNGNSGTIKVAFPGDNTAPGNDAKPGCVVRLDFYGFRQGTYHAVFNAIAPTGSKRLASGDVTITQPRTSGSKFQTSRRFTLDVSGLTPSNAGYHVKVRVTNPAKSGNGAKSKVFYFPCTPGNAAVFTGGGGGLTLNNARSGGSGSVRVGAVPRGGFATGAGGTADTSLPLLPATGLLLGLGLLGGAAVVRRQSS